MEIIPPVWSSARSVIANVQMLKSTGCKRRPMTGALAIQFSGYFTYIFFKLRKCFPLNIEKSSPKSDVKLKNVSLQETS
jgi:hypothetical protein